MGTPDATPTGQPADEPTGREAEMLTILSGAVRTGQQVTIYAFPAGRFGDFETGPDGNLVPLGAQRFGTVNAVESIDLPISDEQHEWTAPGVRVTFADGTIWDCVEHAVATWHGGAKPTLADLKSAEAMVEDTRERNAAEEAAYEAEGALTDFHVHPAVDEDGDHFIVVHTPFDEPDDEPIAITPEQAEQFALRLLRVAAMTRIGRDVFPAHDHDHDH